MTAKRRRPGDWKVVAASREKVDHVMRTVHGLSNVPNIADVGSAAYRRLLASRKAAAERRGWRE
jgi:hypothetical protein